jgi:hypothetical protein
VRCTGGDLRERSGMGAVAALPSALPHNRRGAAELVLLLSVVPLQLAAGAGYQGFSNPVRQGAGAPPPQGALGCLPDHGVMFRQKSDTDGCGVGALFFWACHAGECSPKGDTKSIRQTP